MAIISKALISRRALVAGGGLSAAARLLPDAARAQQASDGFQILRARPGMAPLRGPERQTTAIWGYSGVVPGPSLRIRRGEELKVRLRNELPADTSIHWHGVRVPNGMDGTSLTQKPVAPNTGFDYRFIPPDAGTYWYRAASRTAQARALYGALIVEESEPVEADRDITLLLDAWPSDGAKDSAPLFTVNGLPALDIPVVANERVRLRLVNAAGDRLITLRIDGHPMTVMAIDGQPAEPFPAREGRVTLSPGNRLDLFLDCVLAPASIAPLVLQNEGVDVPIGRLVYADRSPARAVPRTDAKPLPPNPLPARMDFRGALRVDLALDPAARDGAAPAKPLFSIKRGRTVQLALRNGAAEASVLHVHGHAVRLLDALDDGWKPFWLDTILCVPQRTTRIAFVADNPGKWLLHATGIGTAASTIAWFEVAT